MKSCRSFLLAGVLVGLTGASVIGQPAPAPTAAPTAAAEASFQQASEMIKALKLDEALVHLTRAAEGGHVTAMKNLGEMYLFGFGTPADPAKAYTWYKAAADRGNAEAAKTLAELEPEVKGGLLEYNAGLAAYRSENYTEAAAQWELAVTKNHVASLGLLGLLVFDGAGTPANQTRAISLWEKGASLGDSLSMVQLGICYENGEGVKADPAKAIVWYENGGAAGNTQAMYQAGLMHAYGTLIPQNSSKAIAWWKQAAAKGDVRSLLALGQSYEFGQDGPRDYVESLAWYEKAAARGDKGAATAVTRVKGLQASQAEYAQAQAAEQAKNIPLAISEYEKAAAKGNVNALMRLAIAYESGTDVPRNYAKAYAYYLQAADLGAPMADGSALLVKSRMEAEDPVGAAQKMKELRDRINQSPSKD